MATQHCRPQPVGATMDRMAITSIQTITVLVSDQDRALAFFRAGLGFEVRADNEFGDARGLTVAPVGGQTELVLHLPFPGMTAGALRGTVLATDDIDAACARLNEVGTPVDGPDDVPWGRQATFADPDGNGFVLVQRHGE